MTKTITLIVNVLVLGASIGTIITSEVPCTFSVFVFWTEFLFMIYLYLKDFKVTEEMIKEMEGE